MRRKPKALGTPHTYCRLPTDDRRLYSQPPLQEVRNQLIEKKELTNEIEAALKAALDDFARRLKAT